MRENITALRRNTGQSSFDPDLNFEALQAIILAINESNTRRALVLVFGLIEADGCVILTEDGRPVAEWQRNDPKILTHLRSLLNLDQP